MFVYVCVCTWRLRLAFTARMVREARGQCVADSREVDGSTQVRDRAWRDRDSAWRDGREQCAYPSERQSDGSTHVTQRHTWPRRRSRPKQPYSDQPRCRWTLNRCTATAYAGFPGTQAQLRWACAPGLGSRIICWSLNQDAKDWQEHKRCSAALVPLEIPRKPWPCTCLMST